ncbi:MAG: RagB/SusD family nutrient uptake outer membrane protein, partial [Chitinophagaceae bacterium]|nr:RagB/SusD family nutrient uptake outer membrane protein [Chitinophagaceae bacterium]
MHKLSIFFCCLISSTVFTCCEKLITVPPPKHTITTTQVFDNDIQAEGAMAGLYTAMINGLTGSSLQLNAERLWAAGMVTVTAGLSAGEFVNSSGINNQPYYLLSTNRLMITGSGTEALWNSAYKTIYLANSIIEGIAASQSGALTTEARKQFTGEAKLVRALAYFYLLNLYGEVPLVLTVDLYATRGMKKTPVEEIYAQIIGDLKEAREVLRTDYSVSKNEKLRPNKFTASALLARVYLYKRDYPNSAAMAGEVIAQSGLYGLVTDPAAIFVANSREAIWQLGQTTINNSLKNATPEGYLFNSSNLINTPAFNLTDQLMTAFEPDDKRRKAWIDSSSNSAAGGSGIKSYFPVKYKIGRYNGSTTTPKEYYMVLRLAEIFLIRSEARAYGADGGTSAAV